MATVLSITSVYAYDDDDDDDDGDDDDDDDDDGNGDGDDDKYTHICIIIWDACTHTNIDEVRIWKFVVRPKGFTFPIRREASEFLDPGFLTVRILTTSTRIRCM